MRTLIAELGQTRARDHDVPTFVDGATPRYLDGMDLNFRLHSQLFLLLGFPPRFESEASAKYRADDCPLVMSPCERDTDIWPID
jgi:hypothetical protein